MLRITIPATENWDPVKEEFVNTKEVTLQLEHSLLSLSKWEAQYCKPFLNDKGLSNQELIDYIKCMTITQNVDPNVYMVIPNSVLEQVNKYIESPQSATTFSSDEKKKSGPKSVVTSELIYYWMVSFNIPFECEKWHLNRLLTLIRVCNVKNSPSKKMSRGEILNKNKSLNAARRARMHSKG